MAYNIKNNGDLYNQVMQHVRSDVQVPWAWNPDDAFINKYTDKVNSLAGTFTDLFTSLVGRAPENNETNKFVTQYVIPNTNSLADPGSQLNQDPYTNLTSFVSTAFQPEANAYADQQLQGQQGEANRLADLFRTQGNQAISNTESGLLDYQQRLFERLRPNLTTSLQAQGLLNTGGLNQAVAGAQADLATAGTEELRQERFANEQGANAIAYGGASAPYMFNQQRSMQQPDFLRQSGQNAMNQGYNTFLQNLQYQHHLGLMSYQNKISQEGKPSFLSSLGQNFATGLVNAFNPMSATEAYKNYGTGYNQLKQGQAVG